MSMQTHPVTENPRQEDQEFYAQSTHYFDADQHEQITQHVRTISEYLEPALPKLRELAASRKTLGIVELGAGTCLASLTVRKHFPDARLTCVDISLSRMHDLVDKAARVVGVDSKGIRFQEADFTFGLPFEDQQFDLVMFDAALHHSRNMWTTLSECRRLLRPHGAVMALREAYLAPLSYRYALDRMLGSPEGRAGVAENAYLKEQYAYYYRANSLEPRFFRVNPGK